MMMNVRWATLMSSLSLMKLPYQIQKFPFQGTNSKVVAHPVSQKCSKPIRLQHFEGELPKPTFYVIVSCDILILAMSQENSFQKFLNYSLGKELSRRVLSCGCLSQVDRPPFIIRQSAYKYWDLDFPPIVSCFSYFSFVKIYQVLPNLLLYYKGIKKFDR